MRYQIILTTIACSILTACATPYQEMGLRGGVMGLMGGVQASRIDETTVQISAHGNAFTDAETITRYALRKAAEETLADGYDGFYIVSDQDRSRHGTIYTGGSSTTHFSGTAMGVGNNAFVTGTATTDYTPPQTHNFIKPGEAVMIKMFRGAKPSNAPGVYDAHELLRFIVPPQQASNRPEEGKSNAASRPAKPLLAANPAPELSPNALEGALRQIAINAKVPMDMGQNTIITKFEAKGTQLLLTASTSGQAPLISQYDNMATQICALEPQYQILKAGASVRVEYLSASGGNVGTITMTRRECRL